MNNKSSSFHTFHSTDQKELHLFLSPLWISTIPRTGSCPPPHHLAIRPPPTRGARSIPMLAIYAKQDGELPPILQQAYSPRRHLPEPVLHSWPGIHKLSLWSLLNQISEEWPKAPGSNEPEKRNPWVNTQAVPGYSELQGDPSLVCTDSFQQTAPEHPNTKCQE